MVSPAERNRSQRASAPAAPNAPARRQLTRAEIIATGLRLVDQEGLKALSMRRLAQELGVDPMAIYNHVANKEALLDGLAQALWAEVELPQSDETDWEQALRALASSLRGLAHAHPHAHSLLLNRQILPPSALQLLDVVLERLQQAGFERRRAAEVARTVLAYATGFAMVELSYLWLEPPDRAAEPPTQLEWLTRVVRAIPREAPPRLVEVAYTMCDCDMDAQFTLGLDLILTGLRSTMSERTGDSASVR